MMGIKVYAGLMTARQHREQSQRDERRRLSEEAERQRRELRDRVRQRAAAPSHDGNRALEQQNAFRLGFAEAQRQQQRRSDLQREWQRREGVVATMERLLNPPPEPEPEIIYVELEDEAPVTLHRWFTR